MKINYYINTTEKHNKFWIIQIDETKLSVIYKWGRIGTKGQEKTEIFDYKWDLQNDIYTREREKTRKGYIKSNEETFKKMSIEATIVGSSNKCSNIQWVELLEEERPNNLHTIPVIPKFKSIDSLRLTDPSCNPAIRVDLTTKKEYNGHIDHRLLFSSDVVYDITFIYDIELAINNMSNKESSSIPIVISDARTAHVNKNNELFELTNKIKEALGYSIPTI